MLSDSNTKVASEWGAYGEKNAYGRKYMGIHRLTFIIDEDGMINHIFEKVYPTTHANDVLDKLNGMG